MKGKSDPIDAYAAARALLTGEDIPTPKDGDSAVESVRVTHIARSSAVKARSCAMRQIKSLVVTAPDPVREALRPLDDAALIAHLTRKRVTGEGVETTTWKALRH
jgi:hypothetical protein